MNPPGANYRASGEPAIGAASLRGREPAAKADLDPTLQNGRPRRLKAPAVAQALVNKEDNKGPR